MPFTEVNAISAKNPIPPSMWSYNKNIKQHQLNIEKAKELERS